MVVARPAGGSRACHSPKCTRRGTKRTVLGAPMVVNDVAHPVLSPCITLITRWGGLAAAALAGSTVSSFIIRGHRVFDVTLRQPRCARDWNGIRGGGNFRAASWRGRGSPGVLAKRARRRMLDEVRPSRGVDPREVSFVRTMMWYAQPKGRSAWRGPGPKIAGSGYPCIHGPDSSHRASVLNAAGAGVKEADI